MGGCDCFSKNFSCKNALKWYFFIFKKLFLKCKIYKKITFYIKKINCFRNNKQNKSLIFTLNNFKTFNKNKGLNKRFKKKNYSQVVTLFL
jgi:hypothetical protein